MGVLNKLGRPSGSRTDLQLGHSHSNANPWQYRRKSSWDRSVHFKWNHVWQGPSQAMESLPAPTISGHAPQGESPWDSEREISLEISQGSSDWLVSPELAPKPSERETTWNSEEGLSDSMSGEGGTSFEEGPGFSGRKEVLGSLACLKVGHNFQKSMHVAFCESIGAFQWHDRG